jgi:hypothetical protein
MEEFYKRFITTLKEFLSTLNRYKKTNGVEKFLNIYDNLDHRKLMFRYYNITRDLSLKIKSRDETIFNNPINLFPGIDLSQLWTHFTKGQKEKIWTYLHMLFVISELILVDKSDKNKSKEISPQTTQTTQTTQETTLSTIKNEENKLDFDPYVGVGGNDTNYSIDEMFSGPDTLPGTESTIPGISSMAGMMNMGSMGSMLNIGELRDQFKNMTKDDINDATNNIKNLLGPNVDDNTSNLISDMLTNITEELKSDDMANGDPFKNIIKIAETVADKMKPQMESGNVDLNKLWDSTQKLGQNSDAFGGGVNPFSMMTKMMNMMPQQSQQPTQNNDNTQNSQPDPQQMMQGYSDMLQNMGVDSSNMDMNNINKMLQNLQNNPKGPNTK